MNNEYVSLEDLSNELGIDRSNARKWILDLGFKFFKVRSSVHRQLMNAVSLEDANKIKETRKLLGFNSQKRIVASRCGYFYIMLLCPDLSNKRVKLGYTTLLQNRIIAHRTIAPTAKLLISWPCKDYWEKSAIDSLIRSDCVSITNEVYDCEDIEALVERGKQFFEFMPKVLE